MKIRGEYGNSGLGFVNCLLVARSPLLVSPLRLYIDTGASSTTIADRDALRLGIDYHGLEKSLYPTIGVGGSAVDTYLLRNVSLRFRESKTGFHVEQVSEVKILKHIVRNAREQVLVNMIPSVLGLDVLRRYTVRFTKNGVIIENRLSWRRL